MKTEKELLREYLGRKKLKFTRQREEILEQFLSSPHHLSVDDIYDLTKKKNGNAGYATIYRTMKLFVECGIAREIDFRDGKARFEHVYLKAHHDHLVCEKCGKTIEFLNETIESLQEKIARNHRFLVRSHRMEIFGLCKECRSSSLS